MSNNLGMDLNVTCCHKNSDFLDAYLNICRANGYLWRAGQKVDDYDWSSNPFIVVDASGFNKNRIGTDTEMCGQLFNLDYIKSHSLTLEDFLSHGDEFSIGDSFVSYEGNIIEVREDNLSLCNTPQCTDNMRYVLYAKCLYDGVVEDKPTPFQEAGYSKDDIFIIRGKAVKLWKDDGSTVPEFEYVDGVGRLFISLYSLDLIKVVGQYNGRYYAKGLYKFYDDPYGKVQIGRLTAIYGEQSPFEKDGFTWYKYCDPIDVGELGIATQQKYDKVTLAAFALYSGDMTLKEFAQSDLYDEFLHNAGIE